ncbi:peptidoglycan-associated lipoprotein Pal [Ramlibacter sp. AW1]|uniref:Peptidoglycan-associated lipoprotein n=1 Tax=Ramlibacter aurantiacus TaxID=2801330 RepID=A0A937D4H7_9BURK|nr:peptidoglycan-associated lipoprotein Pal [Ramlibacter aurantiacus]
MKKHTWLSLMLAVLLTACSSAVKLDDVPVVDRSATDTAGRAGQTPGGGAGTGTGVGPGASGQSRVAPVAVDDSASRAPGPQNVGRVILFDYDSFVVKPEYAPVLEAHANYLKTNNSRRMTIEGHTDERGGREYNLALGQKRSEAVRRSLVLLGVPDNQLEAVSFGEEKPADPGLDEGAFAKNRRAELAYR